MKTKRWNMGRHRCLLAKESMVSIGFDLHFPKCLEDDGETVARVWSLRLWVGPFIGLIQFNANAANQVLERSDNNLQAEVRQ